MKKWEYKVINAKDFKFDEKKLLEELNLLGETGWEAFIISHITGGEISRVVLKRER